jgi:hypothetical protein
MKLLSPENQEHWEQMKLTIELLEKEEEEHVDVNNMESTIIHEDIFPGEDEWHGRDDDDHDNDDVQDDIVQIKNRKEQQPRKPEIE